MNRASRNARMQIATSTCRRLVRFIAVCAVVLGFSPTSGRAAEDDLSESWIPALRLGFGVHTQGTDGYVASQSALPAIQDMLSSASGDSMTTPFFKGGLRLYTPEFEFRGKPRLFFLANGEIPFDDDFIASSLILTYNRNPDDFNIPGGLGTVCPGAGGGTGNTVSSCSYNARSQISLIAQWQAGIGIDWTLPIDERQYHIAHTLEYYGEAYDSEGRYVQILSRTTNGQPDNEETSIVQSGPTESLHGIAASFFAEVDAWEGEHLTGRLFVGTRLGWILSDRESSYSGSDATGSADFLVRPSSFLISVSGGFEIRWKGF
jgi:hypothetical protein